MKHILSAYHDNSAVIKANGKSMLEVGGDSKYKNYKGEVDTTIKVETITTQQAFHLLKELLLVLG